VDRLWQGLRSRAAAADPDSSDGTDSGIDGALRDLHHVGRDGAGLQVDLRAGDSSTLEVRSSRVLAVPPWRAPWVTVSCAPGAPMQAAVTAYRPASVTGAEVVNPTLPTPPAPPMSTPLGRAPSTRSSSAVFRASAAPMNGPPRPKSQRLPCH
jgi:hypothetical protein